MNGRAIAFVGTLLGALILFRACMDGAGRVSDAKREKAREAELAATYARTPDIVPPIDARPLDQKAKARAEKIKAERFCTALGNALRGKDNEFTRAMIQRAADLQLGVLHLPEQQLIKERRIQMGITTCMAIAAWGRPEDINRSVGSFGVHEQWVYPASYLYFEDGVLTSFQD